MNDLLKIQIYRSGTYLEAGCAVGCTAGTNYECCTSNGCNNPKTINPITTKPSTLTTKLTTTMSKNKAFTEFF